MYVLNPVFNTLSFYSLQILSSVIFPVNNAGLSYIKNVCSGESQRECI